MPYNSDGEWIVPTTSGPTTSKVGDSRGTYTHGGIDKDGYLGEPIPWDLDEEGEVVSAETRGGYGNLVVIRTPSGRERRYAHLNKYHVKVGDRVKKGQVFAEIGNTGKVKKGKGGDGSHLHYEEANLYDGLEELAKKNGIRIAASSPPVQAPTSAPASNDDEAELRALAQKYGIKIAETAPASAAAPAQPPTGTQPEPVPTHKGTEGEKSPGGTYKWQNNTWVYGNGLLPSQQAGAVVDQQQLVVDPNNPQQGAPGQVVNMETGLQEAGAGGGPDPVSGAAPPDFKGDKEAEKAWWAQYRPAPGSRLPDASSTYQPPQIMGGNAEQNQYMAGMLVRPGDHEGPAPSGQNYYFNSHPDAIKHVLDPANQASMRALINEGAGTPEEKAAGIAKLEEAEKWAKEQAGFANRENSGVLSNIADPALRASIEAKLASGGEFTPEETKAATVAAAKMQGLTGAAADTSGGAVLNPDGTYNVESEFRALRDLDKNPLMVQDSKGNWVNADEMNAKYENWRAQRQFAIQFSGEGANADLTLYQVNARLRDFVFNTKGDIALAQEMNVEAMRRGAYGGAEIGPDGKPILVDGKGYRDKKAAPGGVRVYNKETGKPFESEAEWQAYRDKNAQTVEGNPQRTISVFADEDLIRLREAWGGEAYEVQLQKLLEDPDPEETVRHPEVQARRAKWLNTSKALRQVSGPDSPTGMRAMDFVWQYYNGLTPTQKRRYDTGEEPGIAPEGQDDKSYAQIGTEVAINWLNKKWKEANQAGYFWGAEDELPKPTNRMEHMIQDAWRIQMATPLSNKIAQVFGTGYSANQYQNLKYHKDAKGNLVVDSNAYRDLKPVNVINGPFAHLYGIAPGSAGGSSYNVGQEAYQQIATFTAGLLDNVVQDYDPRYDRAFNALSPEQQDAFLKWRGERHMWASTLGVTGNIVGSVMLTRGAGKGIEALSAAAKIGRIKTIVQGTGSLLMKGGGVGMSIAEAGVYSALQQARQMGAPTLDEWAAGKGWNPYATFGENVATYLEETGNRLPDNILQFQGGRYFEGLAERIAKQYGIKGLKAMALGRAGESFGEMAPEAVKQLAQQKLDVEALKINGIAGFLMGTKAGGGRVFFRSSQTGALYAVDPNTGVWTSADENAPSKHDLVVPTASTFGPDVDFDGAIQRLMAGGEEVRASQVAQERPGIGSKVGTGIGPAVAPQLEGQAREDQAIIDAGTAHATGLRDAGEGAGAAPKPIQTIFGGEDELQYAGARAGDIEQELQQEGPDKIISENQRRADAATKFADEVEAGLLGKEAKTSGVLGLDSTEAIPAAKTQEERDTVIKQAIISAATDKDGNIDTELATTLFNKVAKFREEGDTSKEIVSKLRGLAKEEAAKAESIKKEFTSEKAIEARKQAVKARRNETRAIYEAENQRARTDVGESDARSKDATQKLDAVKQELSTAYQDLETRKAELQEAEDGLQYAKESGVQGADIAPFTQAVEAATQNYQAAEQAHAEVQGRAKEAQAEAKQASADYRDAIGRLTTSHANIQRLDEQEIAELEAEKEAKAKKAEEAAKAKAATSTNAASSPASEPAPNSAAATAAEPAKEPAKPKGPSVRMVVDGEERDVPINEEQAKQLAEAKAQYDAAIASSKSHDPEEAAKIRKTAGMRYSAAKRQITGLLTAKEQAKKDKEAKAVTKGKRVTVTVDGKQVEGTVESNPAYGKVKVLLDGDTEATTHSWQDMEVIQPKAEAPAPESGTPEHAGTPVAPDQQSRLEDPEVREQHLQNPVNITDTSEIAADLLAKAGTDPVFVGIDGRQIKEGFAAPVGKTYKVNPGYEAEGIAAIMEKPEVQAALKNPDTGLVLHGSNVTVVKIHESAREAESAADTGGLYGYRDIKGNTTVASAIGPLVKALTPHIKAKLAVTGFALTDEEARAIAYFRGALTKHVMEAFNVDVVTASEMLWRGGAYGIEVSDKVRVISGRDADGNYTYTDVDVASTADGVEIVSLAQRDLQDLSLFETNVVGTPEVEGSAIKKALKEVEALVKERDKSLGVSKKMKELEALFLKTVADPKLTAEERYDIMTGAGNEAGLLEEEAEAYRKVVTDALMEQAQLDALNKLPDIITALNKLTSDKFDPFPSKISTNRKNYPEVFASWSQKAATRFADDMMLDLAEFFDEFINHAEKFRAVDRSILTPEEAKGIIERAFNWYTKGVKDATAYAARAFPELAVNKKGNPVDPYATLVFHSLLGMHSPGTDPASNARAAVNQYYEWKRLKEQAAARGDNPDLVPLPVVDEATFVAVNGNIVDDVAGALREISVNIPGGAFSRAGHNPVIILNAIAKGKFGGNIKKAFKWLHEDHPADEVRAAARLGKSSELDLPDAPTMRGSYVFGAKVGAFVANVHGDLSQLTADLWFTRSWNRAFGTLEIPPFSGSTKGSEPRSETERRAMRLGTKAVADRLTAEWKKASKMGKAMRDILGAPREVQVAEAQSILWYMEQQIWARQGGLPRSQSFEEGTKAHTDNWEAKVKERELDREAVRKAWLSSYYEGTTPERRQAATGKKAQGTAYEGRKLLDHFPPSNDLMSNLATVDTMLEGLEAVKGRPQVPKDVTAVEDGKHWVIKTVGKKGDAMSLVWPAKFATKEEAEAQLEVLAALRKEFSQGPVREASLKRQREVIIEEIGKRTGKTIDQIEGEALQRKAQHALYPTVATLFSKQGGKASGHYGFDYATGPEVIAKVQDGIDSADTSQRQVPALHRKVDITPGDVIVDIGGGKYDDGADALLERGASEVHVLDPFNRTKDHNVAATKALAKKPADKGLIANVLNVIPTAEGRAAVIKAARRYVKEGGTVHIDVYYQSGKERGPTTKGWQEQRPLKSYLPEVQAIYPDARIEKGQIVATVTHYDSGAVSVQAELQRIALQGGTPTDDALVAMLAVKPQYIPNVAAYLLEQRKKLRSGTLTSRDVAKALIITRASIGAGEIDLGTSDLNLAVAGLPDSLRGVSDINGMPAENFQTKGIYRQQIRPEDHMAKFLFTQQGQDLLDHLEQVADGKVELNRELFSETAQITAVRKAYGRISTITDMAKESGKTKAGKYNMDNLGDMTKAINEAGKSGDPAALDRVLRDIEGIGTGKVGFISQLLGFGGESTIDAVEINVWLFGSQRIPEGSQKLKIYAGSEAASGIVKRMVKEGFARVAQSPGIRQQLTEAEMDPENFETIFHHWFWDRAKGTETSHKGLYDAMALAQARQTAAMGNILGMTQYERRADGTLSPATTSLFAGANGSSLIHEDVHVYRRFLPAADKRIAEDWVAGVTGIPVTNGIWEVEHEEAFARGFEQWLLESKLPPDAPKGLEGVFKTLKELILNSYKDSVTYLQKGTVDEFVGPLSDPIRGVYERMIGYKSDPMSRSEQATHDNAVKEARRSPMILTDEARRDSLDMMTTYCRWDFRRMPIVDQRGLLKEIFEVQEQRIKPKNMDDVLRPVFGDQVHEFKESQIPENGRAALQRRLTMRLRSVSQLSPQDYVDAVTILEIDRFAGHAFNALYPNRQVARRIPSYARYLAYYQPDMLLAVHRARATLAGINISEPRWRGREEKLRNLLANRQARPMHESMNGPGPNYPGSVTLHQRNTFSLLGKERFERKLTPQFVKALLGKNTTIPASRLKTVFVNPKTALSLDEFEDAGLQVLADEYEGRDIPVSEVLQSIKDYSVTPKVVVVSGKDAENEELFDDVIRDLPPEVVAASRKVETARERSSGIFKSFKDAVRDVFDVSVKSFRPDVIKIDDPTPILPTFPDDTSLRRFLLISEDVYPVGGELLAFDQGGEIEKYLKWRDKQGGERGGASSPYQTAYLEQEREKGLSQPWRISNAVEVAEMLWQSGIPLEKMRTLVAGRRFREASQAHSDAATDFIKIRQDMADEIKAVELAPSTFREILITAPGKPRLGEDHFESMKLPGQIVADWSVVDKIINGKKYLYAIEQQSDLQQKLSDEKKRRKLFKKARGAFNDTPKGKAIRAKLPIPEGPAASQIEGIGVESLNYGGNQERLLGPDAPPQLLYRLFWVLDGHKDLEWNRIVEAARRDHPEEVKKGEALYAKFREVQDEYYAAKKAFEEQAKDPEGDIPGKGIVIEVMRRLDLGGSNDVDISEMRDLAGHLRDLDLYKGEGKNSDPMRHLKAELDIKEAREHLDPALFAKVEEAYKQVIEARADARRKLDNQGAVNIPFKRTWRDLATKTLIQYATENGYEGIILPSGEFIGERWGPDEGKRMHYNEKLPVSMKRNFRKAGVSYYEETKPLGNDPKSVYYTFQTPYGIGAHYPPKVQTLYQRNVPVNPEAEAALQKVRDYFGTTDNIKEVGMLAPDGAGLALFKDGWDMHATKLVKAGVDDLSLLDFITETGAARISSDGFYLNVETGAPLTRAQAEYLEDHAYSHRETRVDFHKKVEGEWDSFEHLVVEQDDASKFLGKLRRAEREAFGHKEGYRTLYSANPPAQDDAALFEALEEITNTFVEAQQASLGTIIGDLRKSLMLSSLKTHLRNIAGNLAYQAIEEVSRIPAVMFDVIAATRYGQRSTVLNPMDLVRSVVHTFSTRDGETAVDQGGFTRAWREIMGVNTALDAEEATQGATHDHGWNIENPVVRLLEGISQISFRALAAEDAFFNTFAMRRSLLDMASTAVKNGDAVSQEEFLANLDEETAMRAYRDALVATFNSSNIASSAITKLKVEAELRGYDIVKLGLDVLIPFDRTPTNLILRTLDYTPIGLFTGSGGRSEREYKVNRRVLADGTLGQGDSIRTSLHGKIAQAEMLRRIDKTLESAFTKRDLQLLQREMSKQVGRGLIGTIIIIGAAMSAKGILRGVFGGLDDDDDEQGRISGMGNSDDKLRNRTEGQNRNSIRIGNRWWSIDGMPPIGNLLLLGASINESMYRGETNLQAGGSLLLEVGRQALQLPVVRGFTDLGQAMGDDYKFASFGGRIVSSFIPAIVRDIAAFKDKKDRETGSGLQGVVDNIKMGIPGKLGGFGRESLPVAKDWLGREAPEESTLQSGVGAFLDIFRSVESRSSGLDPDSVGKGADADKVFKELSRHDITLTKPTKEDGESEEDYNKRVTVVGTAVYRALQAEVQSDRYKEMAGLRDKAGNPMQAEQLKTVMEKAKGRAEKHLNRILKERGKVEPEKPVEYPHQIAAAKAKAEADKRKAAKAAAKAAQFPEMPTLSSLIKPKKPKPVEPKTLEALDEPAQPRRANHPWNFEEDEGGGWQ